MSIAKHENPLSSCGLMCSLHCGVTTTAHLRSTAPHGRFRLVTGPDDATANGCFAALVVIGNATRKKIVGAFAALKNQPMVSFLEERNGCAGGAQW